MYAVLSVLGRGKAEVKLSLLMPWRHVQRVEVELHFLLISALNGGMGGYLHAPVTTCWEGALGTFWIRGWVGPRANLDTFLRRDKSPTPTGIWTSDRLARSLVTVLSALSWLLLLFTWVWKLGWGEDGEGVWSQKPDEIRFSAVASTGRVEKMA